MPQFEPTDPFVLGQLFSDLVLARRIIAQGTNKVSADAAAALETDLVNRLGDQQYVDDLKQKLVDFVLDPTKRFEYLKAAGLNVSTGPGKSSRPLTAADTAVFDVLLDSNSHYHITMPDDFEDIRQFNDDNWLLELGKYIMRKCK